jgi:hypothetical protein
MENHTSSAAGSLDKQTKAALADISSDPNLSSSEDENEVIASTSSKQSYVREPLQTADDEDKLAKTAPNLQSQSGLITSDSEDEAIMST